MNILHITAQKPSSTGSGVYLTQLARAIGGISLGGDTGTVRQGILCGAYAGDAAEDLTGCGIKLYPVLFDTPDLPFHIFGMSDVMPYPSAQYSRMTDGQREAFSRAFLDEADRASADLRPDVILCHHLYLLTALIREHFPDIPVYAFCHNTDLMQRRSHELAAGFIDEQIPRLDGVFALHEEQKKQIAATFSIDGTRIRIIGAGYDPQIFCPGTSRTAEDVPHTVRLVFAGKLSAAKGVPSLLRALSLIGPDHSLTLAGSAGDPEEAGILREIAAGSPASVSFCGRLTQPELAALYRRSDIFVLPSWNEGLPLCVIEALACGLRVVITDLPGIREWICANIGDAPVTYIPLPREAEQQFHVSGSCDPNALSRESQAAFERALAGAVIAAGAESSAAVSIPDLSGLTWRALAGHILAIITAD